MLRLRVLLAVAAMVTSPAFAGSNLPAWDMRAFCASRLPSPGVDDCVKLQNEARDDLKQTWSKLDADFRAECLDMLQSDFETDKVLPSYLRLSHCVQFEQKKRGL